MDLTEEQKNDLAEVLAERLVGFAIRRATAEEAGMPDAQVAGEPVRSWRLLIDEALERGRFLQLLKAAARQSPGDVSLEAIAEGVERGVLVLPEPPAPPPPWRALAIGAVGALAIVGVVLAGVQVWRSMGDGRHQVEPEPTTAGEKPHVEVLKGLPDEAPKPRPHGTGTKPEPEPEPEPEPAPALPPGKYIKIPEPPEPEPAPEPAAPAPAAAPAPGACTGFAYAGKERPAVSGGRWTPAVAVNVRAWYPTADNDYDTSGTVVCVVPGGAAVPAGEPIEVGGGSWWVPVQGGP